MAKEIITVTVKSSKTDAARARCDLLAVGIFSGGKNSLCDALDKKLKGAIANVRKLGDFKAARASCSDALSIFQRLEWWSGVANCLDLLGTVAFRAGETDKAKGLLTKAIATYRQANDVSRCASPLNNLAGIDFRAGNLEGARVTLLESLRINREYGDRAGIAGNLNNLGFISK